MNSDGVRLGRGMRHGLPAACRQQLRSSLRGPNQVAVVLLGVPQAIALGWLVHHSGSGEALVRVVFGLALLSAWTTSALYLSWLVTEEAWSGTFEMALASPAPLAPVFMAKGLALVAAGLAGGAVAAAAALAMARELPSIERPGLFALAFGVLATVVVPVIAFTLAPLSTLTPAIRAFTNGLIPVGIVLGGFLFPVDALPAWAVPVARLVPISWGTDAMVGAAGGWGTARWAAHLGAALGLSAAWATGALRLFAAVERRYREQGALPT